MPSLKLDEAITRVRQQQETESNDMREIGAILQAGKYLQATNDLLTGIQEAIGALDDNVTELLQESAETMKAGNNMMQEKNSKKSAIPSLIMAVDSLSKDIKTAFKDLEKQYSDSLSQISKTIEKINQTKTTQPDAKQPTEWHFEISRDDSGKMTDVKATAKR